jgi:hypothetical protein
MIRKLIDVWLVVLVLVFCFGLVGVQAYEAFGGRHCAIRQEEVVEIHHYVNPPQNVLITFDKETRAYARYRLPGESYQLFKPGDVANIKVWRGNITGFDYMSEVIVD